MTTEQPHEPSEAHPTEKQQERYTVLRDAGGRAWLKSPGLYDASSACCLVDAIEAIALHSTYGLTAVVNGKRVVIDSDPAWSDAEQTDDPARARQRRETVEALVLQHVSPVAKPALIPAAVMVGKDHAVAFQCYESIGKRRYGVVTEFPVKLETRRDPGDYPVSIYVLNDALSFDGAIVGGFGPRIEPRAADQWVDAITRAIALGVRYIDLVTLRTPEELLQHAHDQAAAAK